MIVLKKIIPVAYFSSPPYFAESNAVVIGAGIPAIITVIPRSIGSIGKNAVIANSNFLNNSAIYGGAVSVRDMGIIANSTFEYNYATFGGAIYIVNSLNLIADSTFKYNKANSNELTQSVESYGIIFDLAGNNVGRYFKDYIAASSINISKSDAIKKIIDENKIECAIYVGDTIYDQKASIAASIPFIWASSCTVVPYREAIPLKVSPLFTV